ncbi:MAG: YceI family protein, partial [Proteobacteria bacterium]|nr:YceI family protein [Pseudomonadota bacterium]
YRIDPDGSELRLLVYRGGPLARLGHNHVIIAHGLDGEAVVGDDPDGARLALSFPVAALAIDEPAARREEGAEFASLPSAEDVAGTRRNLESPAVLDAARFPTVRLEAVLGRVATGLVAHATVTLRGRDVPVEVPLTLVRRPGELLAEGGLELSQRALGLTPFSVALGALTVRDEVAVRFRIRATPAVAVPPPRP